MAGINNVIENFNSLQLEEKEFAVDLVRKIYAEEAREAISKRAGQAIQNLKNGKVKEGSLSDLYKDLEND